MDIQQFIKEHQDINIKYEKDKGQDNFLERYLYWAKSRNRWEISQIQYGYIKLVYVGDNFNDALEVLTK